MRLFAALALFCAFAVSAAAQAPASEAATRAVYLDKAGVIRWQDNNKEVALFGANYCLMSGSDYRMAGLLHKDRKKMIDEDMAQFARMGWTALRLCSWGDWENSDRQGNLVVNDHVDLLDYLIAKAHERGIYILLTPIHGYDPSFPDQMGKPSTNVGFSRWFPKSEMGTNPQSIAAQTNYIGQLLNHVNKYTGVALKNEPALLFIEVINEPIHHPDDIKGSIAYINALVKAVRDTGCKKLTFYNVSQDFRIAPAIRDSNVDGASFGWYPSALVAGHTDKGNFLQAVDDYPDMLRPELKGKPRIVYEFDTADMATGYMYPAMARTYRAVGAQFASMFAYDQLETAPYNLGWQTHFMNLVHSPRKAVSAIIAAEAMRRLPRYKSYGRYPDDRDFGDFHVRYDDDSSVLAAPDAYMNAGPSKIPAPAPRTLTRVVGLGSSPLVNYEGSGIYFLDKVRDGIWRLEVYPDEVLVRDPFEQPRPDKIVSRLLYRDWPMHVSLPGLGNGFTATPINVPQDSAAKARRASGGTVAIEPGVWVMSANAKLDRASLPARIARVGFDEYHVNEPVSYPDDILDLSPATFVTGGAMQIRVRVANTVLPDAVKLWLRPAGVREFGDAIPMTRISGNDYQADAGALAPGLYEYAVSATTGERSTTFPGTVSGQPGEWPFQSDHFWKLRVVAPDAPLRLLDPKTDYANLAFVRPEETVRSGLFHIVPSEDAGESALSFALPDLGATRPERYAASLYIGDRIAARGSDPAHAAMLHVRLKSADEKAAPLDIALIEKDGAAWHATVTARPGWSDIAIPLADLKIGRSILIPTPFPGLWDYWRAIPQGRGGAGDHIHAGDVERLELTVNRGGAQDGTGVTIESVWLSEK
jgi:hypothetical protein